MAEKYLGRIIKEKKTFKVEGTFESMYAAERWLHKNGYSYGSTCKNRSTGGNCPVAIIYGPYDLPQKWINFDKEDKAAIDGVIISDDFREGEVTVLIFESNATGKRQPVINMITDPREQGQVGQEEAAQAETQPETAPGAEAGQEG